MASFPWGWGGLAMGVMALPSEQWPQGVSWTGRGWWVGTMGQRQGSGQSGQNSSFRELGASCVVILLISSRGVVFPWVGAAGEFCWWSMLWRCAAWHGGGPLVIVSLLHTGVSPSPPWALLLRLSWSGPQWTPGSSRVSSRPSVLSSGDPGISPGAPLPGICLQMALVCAWRPICPFQGPLNRGPALRGLKTPPGAFAGTSGGCCPAVWAPVGGFFRPVLLPSTRWVPRAAGWRCGDVADQPRAAGQRVGAVVHGARAPSPAFPGARVSRRSMPWGSLRPFPGAGFLLPVPARLGQAPARGGRAFRSSRRHFPSSPSRAAESSGVLMPGLP